MSSVRAERHIPIYAIRAWNSRAELVVRKMADGKVEENETCFFRNELGRRLGSAPEMRRDDYYSANSINNGINSISSGNESGSRATGTKAAQMEPSRSNHSVSSNPTPGALEKQGRRTTCSYTNCSLSPSFGVEGGHREFCSRHTLSGMVWLDGTTCSRPGCLAEAAFGVAGSKVKKFCARHAEHGAVLINSGQCNFRGCKAEASHGTKGSKLLEFCATHAKAGMTMTGTKTCSRPGCLKRPSYGVPGSGKPEACAQHAADGMVNVVSKRCIYEGGCSKIPTFGVKGTGTRAYCSRHAAPGMVTVGRKMCRHGDCHKFPTYGEDGSTKRVFCARHALPGMIDFTRKCASVGCFHHATYGDVSGCRKRKFCARHAGEGMKRSSSITCERPGCRKSAAHLDWKRGIPDHGDDSQRKMWFCSEHADCRDSAAFPAASRATVTVTSTPKSSRDATNSNSSSSSTLRSVARGGSTTETDPAIASAAATTASTHNTRDHHHDTGQRQRKSFRLGEYQTSRPTQRGAPYQDTSPQRLGHDRRCQRTDQPLPDLTPRSAGPFSACSRDAALSSREGIRKSREGDARRRSYEIPPASERAELLSTGGTGPLLQTASGWLRWNWNAALCSVTRAGREDLRPLANSFSHIARCGDGVSS